MIASENLFLSEYTTNVNLKINRLNNCLWTIQYFLKRNNDIVYLTLKRLQFLVFIQLLSSRVMEKIREFIITPK